MARKAIQLSSTPAKKVDTKVEAVALDASHLITVSEPIDDKKLIPKKAHGSIVRLRPGAEWGDDMVRETRDHLESVAQKVIVLPRPSIGIVPAQIFTQPNARRSDRDVVLALVEESGSEDREALKALVESVMGECGL